MLLFKFGFIELYFGIGVCVELRGFYKCIFYVKGDSNNGFGNWEIRIWIDLIRSKI